MRRDYDLLYKPISVPLVPVTTTAHAIDQSTQSNESNQARHNRTNPLSFNDERAGLIAMRANQYSSRASSQQLTAIDKSRDQEAELQFTQDELLGRSNGNYPV